MTLNLPDTFCFSQSSLQAYANCARRFWLAYVEQLPWPAVEAKPVADHERQMRLGSGFHRLVERAESGLEPELLARGLEPPLDDWFAAYRRHRPRDLPRQHLEIERVLSIPFGVEGGRFRLAAKYDLIAAERSDDGGRVVVVDWKTNQRPTRRAVLQQRLQTLVYPYVLVEASQAMPWGPVEPEAVEMRYWFAAAPAETVSFPYSRDLHAAHRSRLQQMLQSILAGQVERDFPLVADGEENRRRFCRFCVYRSRCDRGIDAGPVAEGADEDFFVVDPDTALEFSLDEVEELAF